MMAKQSGRKGKCEPPRPTVARPYATHRCCMNPGCRIKTVQAQRVLVTDAACTALDWGETLEELLRAIWQHLDRSFEQITVGPAMARIDRDAATDWRLTAGFPTAEEFDAEPPLRWETFGGGRAATFLHEGPYARLPDAELDLRRFVEAEGLHVAAAPWLIFWVDPDSGVLPAELRTELVWPLDDA